MSLGYAPALQAGELGELLELVGEIVPDPADPGTDAEAVWRELTRAGLAGLAVPEPAGGGGLGLHELIAVQRVLGRRIYSGPFLSTSVLAVAALTHESVASATAAAELREIAGGKAVAVALTSVRIERSRAGSAVSGELPIVVDADEAGALVVFARGSHGLHLALVGRGQPGVRVDRLTSVDLRRPLCRVLLERATAEVLVADPGHAAANLETLSALASVAIAAESLGGAEAIFERTVEYLKQRVQFGRPIASFQAIKHRCAELLVDLEYARSALAYALRSPDRLGMAASVAKLVACDAFVRIATECIQLHGGIGYTWEHSAHLYYRRAWSNALLFGTSAEHRRRIADAVLGPAAA